MSSTDRNTDKSNHTKVRHLRVPDPLWIAAAEKANAEGANISEVNRALLRGYVDGRFRV